MKIAIFGAGAIGGHLGALLAAQDGIDLTLFARGPHAAAMRERGLELLSGGHSSVTRPRIGDDPAAVGPQDYVFLTLKAHQAPALVDMIRPLLGPDTVVISAVNGIPWWYFHRLPGALAERVVEASDPDGRLWHGIGPHRALGCLTHVAAEVPEPGVVRHTSGLLYQLGEPDGTISPRLERIVAVLRAAGLDAGARPSIRDDVWAKLLGNVGFNPLAALTLTTVGNMVADPRLGQLLRRLMGEALAVARAVGASPAVAIEDRLARSATLVTHKSSMHQDVEKGRSLEIDPIVRAVADLGDMVGVDTPFIDAVYAIVRARAQAGGLYPA